MTADRQRLYEHILDEQRQSLTGQLYSEDTFDLYQTFMALADADESSRRQRTHEDSVDQQVHEQRLSASMTDS